jgi:hypothetical protein
MPQVTADPYPVLRRLLLALLAFGLAGTGTELLLLGHYEDPWQLVPLGLVALALGAIAAHAMSGDARSVQALRFVMVLLIVAAAAGILLHYRGNLAFQVDMDPTATKWALFKKVVRAKAPPALAPGALAQMGLLGLIYTYRHPALRRDVRVTTGASV